jgi:hypothetical protein
MSDVNTKQYTKDDPSLVSAWQTLVQYDLASKNQKRTHAGSRRAVVVMSFLTTLLAVFLTGMSDTLSAEWTQVLRVCLVLFPLTSAALMAYANEFTPPQKWFQYRATAETLRRQIYLYRANGGDYFDKSFARQQELLRQAIQQSSANNIAVHVDLPKQYRGTIDEAVIVQTAKGGSGGHDANPFGPVSLDLYINARIKTQQYWYIHRCTTDYQNLKQARRLGLMVTVCASLFAYFQQDPLVAIATAGAVLIGLWSDLGMYGRTYSIYSEAATNLGDLWHKWLSNTAEQDPTPRQTAAFIEACENVFADEMNRWMQQVEQSQTQFEQNFQRIAEPTTPPRPAAHSSPATAQAAPAVTPSPSDPSLGG